MIPDMGRLITTYLVSVFVQIPIFICQIKKFIQIANCICPNFKMYFSKKGQRQGGSWSRDMSRLITRLGRDTINQVHSLPQALHHTPI